MINNRYMLIAICIGLLVFFILSSNQMSKTKPIKEGTIWRVVWGEKEENCGLYREKMPNNPIIGKGGEYAVDMHGILYPTCLEIRYSDNRNPNSEIIPLSKIISLEFCSDSIPMDK
jgi:hypothetical protein